MAKGDKDSVIGQEAWTLLEVDVGDVGDVQTQFLHQSHQWEFIAIEVGGTLAEVVVIWAVERHFRGPVRVPIGTAVKVVATIEVVGLPGGHGIQNDHCRVRLVVSYGDRHPFLGTVIANELE